MRSHPLTGPLLVLIGGLALLVVSLRTWYEVDLAKIPGGLAIITRYAKASGYATTANAWEPWGPLSDLILFLVIAGAIVVGGAGLAILRDRRRAAFGAIAAGVAGILLTVLHAVGEPQPREIVTVQPVAWLGVLCCVVILAGGAIWWDRLVHGPAAATA